MDLSQARGTRVGALLQDAFVAQSFGTPYHAVFLSHRGAGKSTEINAVLGNLAQRYLPVYFEADSFLDHRTATPEELLLVIAQQVDQNLRDAALPLPGELLDRIHLWFSERIITDSTRRVSSLEVLGRAGIGGNLPLLAQLLVQLSSLLRFEGEVRAELRSRLRQYPGALLEVVNQLLDAANERLRPSGREVLVAVDNMDRFDLPAAREIVGDRDLLVSTRCKLLLTPPIALDCVPDVNLRERYYRLLMPSVRLRERLEPYETLSGPGPGLLLDVLRKRLDLDRIIPDEQARARLVLASGGALRELFQLLLEASYESGGSAVSWDVVQRVVARFRRDQRSLVSAHGWWDVLRAIRDTKDRVPGQECQAALYRRLAFYYNDAGWYDIHPLLAEQPELGLGPSAPTAG
ncbi:MAG: hypothetical protein FJX77_00240 [Armatimonadetes bacterium]|nr:hypothetical protein [Armatimonadota bacterium]